MTQKLSQLAIKLSKLIHNHRPHKVYYLKAPPMALAKVKITKRFDLQSRTNRIALGLIGFLIIAPVISRGNLLLKSKSHAEVYDLKLYPAPSNSNYLYQNTVNGFKVYLGNRLDEKKPKVRFEEMNSSVEFVPDFDQPLNNNTQLLANDKSLMYKNVLPGIDLKYSLNGKGIKEEIILQAQNNTEEETEEHGSGNLAFKFNLSLMNAVPKKSLEGETTAYFIEPINEEYRFHIPKPFMIDAAGNRSEEVELEIHSLSSINQNGGSSIYEIILKPSQEWLQSAVYPVSIDPSIVHDESSEFSGTTNRIEDAGSGTSPKLRTPYHELPADEHTVGLWHINETSENSCSGSEDACDSSGNGNHGTATGTTIETSNQKLGAAARDFNGSSDYINMGSSSQFNLTGDLTIEAWIKMDSFGESNNGRIVSWRDVGDTGGYEFYVRGTSYGIGFLANNTAYYSNSGVIDTGRWYHVAVVRKDPIVTYYVDGIEQGTSYVPTINSDNGPLYVSKRGYDAARYFDGLIDEVRISDIARTAEEIKQDAQRFPYGVYSSDTIDLTSGEGTVASAELEWTDNVSTPGATLDGYSNFKPVIIDNTQNSNDLTDYQVKVDVDYDSNMQSDFDDLRFTSHTATVNAYGNEAAFNSAITDYPSVTSLDSTHFIAGYRDDGGDDYGCAKIGTVTGTTISYGSEYCFNEAYTIYISLTALDSTHFIAGYTDSGGSAYGCAKVGTVSGTTISYGSEYCFNEATTAYISADALSSSGFVVGYKDDGGDDYGCAKVGTVSGTTISYGSEYCFNEANSDTISAATLESSKFVIGYRDAGGFTYGCAKVGTISETTISFGSEVCFNEAASTYISIDALTPTHAAIAYYSGGDDQGHVKIGIISGSSISYGSDSAYNATGVNHNSLATLDSTHFAIGYNDTGGDDDGHVKIGTVNGTTVTYGDESTFNATTTYYTTITALDSTNFVVGYRDDGGDDYGHARVGTAETTNLDYWIEEKSDGVEAEVWVEVDTIPASSLTTIWMWYGNGGASAGSNGSNTFLFFDDFNDGTISTTKWPTGTRDTTGFTESGGYLNGSNTTGYLTSNVSFTGNYIQETLHQRTTDATNGYQSSGFYASASDAYGVLIHPTTSWYIFSDGAWNGAYTTYTSTDWVRTKVVAIGSTSYVQLNRALNTTQFISNGGLSSEYVRLGRRYDTDGLNNQAYSAKWDWLFVREYASPEPIVGVGADIEFQTHTSSDGSSWEAWKPTTNEMQIDSMDTLTWATPSASLYAGVPIATSSATTIKMEGAASMKTTVGAPQAGPNTRGLWHFEETGGTGAYILDETANNNDGTPTGTTITDGFYGKARSFNGSSDWISVGNPASLQITGQLTLEAWVNTSASIAFRGIISKMGTGGGQYGYLLRENSGNGYAEFGVSSNGTAWTPVLGTTAINDGKWHHLAGVYTPSTKLEIYVDGVLQNTNSTSIPASIYNTAGGVSIGSAYTTPLEMFNGMIDEARVSNTARTSEEIAEAYRAGRDHRLQRTISSTDLSGKTKVPFYFAADKQGTIAETYVGETDQAVYGVDSNTKGLWHLDENTSDYEGPNSPGTVVDDSAVGTKAWSNPNNAKTSNDSDATATTTLPEYGSFYTHYLKATNLGFNIPSNAKIFGIRVQIERAANYNQDFWLFVDDSEVKIVKDGSIGSTNKASGTNWPTTDAYASYGGSSDLWGETWTANDINASNFGVVLSARLYDNYIDYGAIAYVDHMRIDVWYSDIKDESSSANHGRTTVGTSFTQGKIGGGRYFDGSDDYLEVPDSSSLDLTTGLTLDAWVYFTGTFNATQNSVLEKAYYTSGSDNGGYQLVVDNGTSGNVGCAVGNNDWDPLSSNSTLTPNTWYHLACTFNGSTLKVYINGKEDNSVGTSVSSIKNISQSFNIGSTSAGTYNFQGIIDEARVSNTARTADEIRLAYQYGLRTHQITVDFEATLDSGNLITGSGDYSFTVDATAYGLEDMGDGLYVGDKVIVKENYNGTNYIAQGDVTSVNTSTGSVSISAWDAGSTFPSGGYTANATVFKWQREYWDLNDISPNDRNATTKLGLRILDANEGFTMYLDDFRSNTNYLTDSGGSTVTSTANRYIQYRAILSTNNTEVTPELTSVTIDYNRYPTAPTSLLTNDLINPGNVTDTTPYFSAIYNDPDEGDVANKYQIQVDDNSDFGSTIWDPGSSGTAMTNCLEGNRCEDITYGGASTDLQWGTQYFWRIRYWDEDGAEGDWSTEGDYFVMKTIVRPHVCVIDDGSQPDELTLKWQDETDLETGYRIEKDIDDGGFNFLVDKAVDSISHLDSDTSAENVYQYRIRAESNNGNSEWCTTAEVDFSTGSFMFEGVQLEGVKID